MNLVHWFMGLFHRQGPANLQQSCEWPEPKEIPWDQFSLWIKQVDPEGICYGLPNYYSIDPEGKRHVFPQSYPMERSE